MRITGNTVVRRYMSNLERNFSNKNNIETGIMKQRGFWRASQNPINATKALRVRKSLRDIADYRDNLETAKSLYENAESSVMNVSDILKSAYEKLIEGADGTRGDAEDDILATALEQFADEMIQTMNIVVADRRIFGGVNNTGNAYTVEKGTTGTTVSYNGVPVNTYTEASMFPYSEVSYTDIGIGMTTLSDGSIDPQSALAVTFNGAEVLGCGLDKKVTTLDLENMSGEYSLDFTIGTTKKTITFYSGADNEDTANNINQALEETFGAGNVIVSSDGVVTNNILGSGSVTVQNTPLLNEENDNYVDYDQAAIQETSTGYSNNIIQLVYDAAECLRSHDKEGSAKYADQLFSALSNLTLSITNIGNSEEFVDYTLDRITNNEYTLMEQQQRLEQSGLDYMSKQITEMTVMESLYNASLQMSTSVIPMSIFNFI